MFLLVNLDEYLMEIMSDELMKTIGTRDLKALKLKKLALFCFPK